jgi:hypothetical protein
LIANDCAFGQPAAQSLATLELRAEVLVVPGRLGPPERPAQARYHDMLRALIAAASPRVIVVCDGDPASFAPTLALCRTASQSPALSTRVTGALTFTVTPDGSLFIRPYHRNSEAIRLPPLPSPHEFLQPSALETKPRNPAFHSANTPFSQPELTTSNADQKAAALQSLERSNEI